jgi:hypothetical protein
VPAAPLNKHRQLPSIVNWWGSRTAPRANLPMGDGSRVTPSEMVATAHARTAGLGKGGTCWQFRVLAVADDASRRHPGRSEADHLLLSPALDEQLFRVMKSKGFDIEAVRAADNGLPLSRCCKWSVSCGAEGRALEDGPRCGRPTGPRAVCATLEYKTERPNNPIQRVPWPMHPGSALGSAV